MSEAPPLIARRTLAILLLAGGLAFLGAMALRIFGEPSGRPETVDPSAFSRSAIGHMAFVETLRRLDLPVLVSRYRPTAGPRASSTRLSQVSRDLALPKVVGQLLPSPGSPLAPPTGPA